MIFRRLIAALFAFALCFSDQAFAGYAQMKPPPGWSAGMGAAVPGTAGTYNFGQAANGAVFKGSTVLTNAALNVGGTAVTVPVVLRTAANAGTFAAAFAFGNPALFTALAVGSLAYQWFDASQTPVKVVDGRWSKMNPDYCLSSCFEYFWQGVWYLSFGSAAEAVRAFYETAGCPGNATGCVATITDSFDDNRGAAVFVKNTFTIGGTTGFNTNSYGIVRQGSAPRPVSWTPIGDTEFHRLVDPLPLPAGLPQMLPTPLPVQQPVFNPDPNYDPATNPASRPMWIPTGDPVKQPNPVVQPTPENPNPIQNPDVWRQPGIRVTPAPSPSNPWQVETSPAYRDSPNATPQREPLSETDTVPIPTPDPNAPPRSPDPQAVTCGLPGTPPCKIDESGTNSDAGTTFGTPKTKIDEAKTAAETAITAAGNIAAPAWSFTFQLPTGCAPYVTGIKGVILNVCQFQSTIHGLLSAIWAAATVFAMIGMVGRTIREA